MGATDQTPQRAAIYCRFSDKGAKEAYGRTPKSASAVPMPPSRDGR